jgi:hypothetical protein
MRRRQVKTRNAEIFRRVEEGGFTVGNLGQGWSDALGERSAFMEPQPPLGDWDVNGNGVERLAPIRRWGF